MRAELFRSNNGRSSTAASRPVNGLTFLPQAGRGRRKILSRSYVWKLTKKRTHNRFYNRRKDAALCTTLGTFQADPKLGANHVARFL
jgi:hypothetical protein